MTRHRSPHLGALALPGPRLLIPLLRFPGFLSLIAAGLLLPASRVREARG